MTQGFWTTHHKLEAYFGPALPSQTPLVTRIKKIFKSKKIGSPFKSGYTTPNIHSYDGFLLSSSGLPRLSSLLIAIIQMCNLTL